MLASDVLVIYPLLCSVPVPPLSVAAFMYLNPHFCPFERQSIYAFRYLNHPFPFSNSLVRVFGHLQLYIPTSVSL